MYNLVKDGEDYFRIGKVIKTQAFRGEVVFLLEVAETEAYSKLDWVFIDIDQSLVPWFIESIRINSGQAIVKLQDIDTPEQAQKLLRRELYLPKARWENYASPTYLIHELPGYRVFDAVHGDIGIVDDILERSEQELIRIMKDGREILVPFDEDLIESIDEQKKEIHLKTPEGLIDLYLL